MQSTMSGNDNALPPYPLSSLSDAHLGQSMSVSVNERQPEVSAYGDASVMERMSEMENMGYDQVNAHSLTIYGCHSFLTFLILRI